MRHLFLTRTNALQGVKCLLNSTRRDELGWVGYVSNTWGECVLPVQIAIWERQISLHRSQRFSCHDCLASPVVLPAVEQISTSPTIFAVSLLCVFHHADWLDRSVSEFRTHAALACAREACSKPRSPCPIQGSEASSFLSFVSRSILRTAGPTSAYPRHY